MKEDILTAIEKMLVENGYGVRLLDLNGLTESDVIEGHFTLTIRATKYENLKKNL